jgi:hypothetical protein
MDPVHLFDYTDLVMSYGGFSQLSQVRAFESSGVVERGMGIEPTSAPCERVVRITRYVFG